MSQNNFYDANKISEQDWEKILGPTQKQLNNESVKADVTDDLYQITEAVRQGRKPEEVWNTLNLSRNTGLAYSTVEGDQQTALALSYKKALQGQLEPLREIVKNSPDMLAFVQSRPNMEQAVLATDKPLWNMEANKRSFIEDIGYNFESGKIAQERSRLLQKDFLGSTSAEEQQRITELGEWSAARGKRNEKESFAVMITRAPVEFLPQLGDMGLNVAARVENGLPAGVAIGAGLGSAAGGVGAIPGAIAGGLAGISAGVVTGSAEHAFYQNAAELWGNVRDLKDDYGNKIDPAVARTIAATGGLLASTLDMVSFKATSKLVPGADKLLNFAALESAANFLRKNPKLATGFNSSIGKGISALLTESTTEAVQEAVFIKSEEIAKNTSHMEIAPISDNEFDERVFEAGKQAFATMFLPSVAGTTAHALAGRRTRSAELNVKTLDELHKNAINSETVKNSPELAGEVLQHLGEKSGVDTMYIQPEAFSRVFFQSEAGLAAAAEMGITPENLNENTQLGVDVAIPVEKALQHIIANEQTFNELKPNMRLAPEVSTNSELQELNSSANTDSELDAESAVWLDEMYNGLDEEVKVQQQREAIAAPYVEQLVTAGHSQEQAQHLAAPFVANAEIMAPMFNVSPEEYLQQHLAGFVLTNGKTAGQILAKTKNYNQPLNQDVNLDKNVSVVVAEPENIEVWQARKGEDKKTLLNSIVGSVLNEASGLQVQITKKNAKHLLNSATARGLGGKAHIAAVRQMHELMRVAEKIESYPDQKKQDDIKNIHRFYAPMRYENAIFTVNMTVKEFEGERLLSLEGVHKLYDLKLEKEAPILLENLSTEGSQGVFPISASESAIGISESLATANSTLKASNSSITIRQMLEAVKDKGGKSFFQPVGKRSSKVRGNITFVEQQAVIALFKGKKNLSTVIHESGHYFLENLCEAAQLGNAPEWVNSSWSALQKEYGFTGFELTEPTHERFAREYEAYARAGKAPTAHLQSAFKQFSKWLTRIYKSVRSLLGKQDLSPEVKRVFDRLLATEEEINAIAKDNAWIDVVQVLEDNGATVPTELKGRYLQAIAKAKQATEDKISVRLTQEAKHMEQLFKEEAKATVAQDPFYQAQNAVAEAGGINLESALDFADKNLIEDLRRKGVINGNGKGGIDFIEAMANFEIDTPEQLLGLLASKPTQKEAIQAMTTELLTTWKKYFDYKAEYSAELDEALALELEAITGEKQVSSLSLKAAVERRIGIKKDKDVQVEYRALKEALRKQDIILKQVLRKVQRKQTKDLVQTHEAGVLAGGMHEGAKGAKQQAALQNKLAELKQKERLQRAALVAAYQARIERKELLGKIRKNAVSKSVSYAYKQQILSLVAHWRGLGTESMMPHESVMPLTEFLDNAESLFGEIKGLFPSWLLEEDRAIDAKRVGDLSLVEMRELARAIKILAHHGREADRLTAFAQQVRISEVAGECIQAMSKMSGTGYLNEQERASTAGRVKGFLRGTVSELTSMRFLFSALDGYKNSQAPEGPHQRYMVSALQQAMSSELSMTREYSGKLSAAFKELQRKDARKNFEISGVPLSDDVRREWGGMWNHEKVVATVLNLGNEGNKQAVMNGYGWSEEHLNKIVEHLSSSEIQAVQKIWDIIDELYPQLNDIHQQMHGVPLQKVVASPINMQATNGEIVALRGGYYPLVFDQRFSKRAEEQQVNADLINRTESMMRSPKTQSGMTKERKGGKLPPKLALSVVSQHIKDTVHYVTHAAPLRNIYTVTNLPEYQEAFIRAAGTEAHNELLPWLRHIARPEGEQVAKLELVAEWMVKRGTIFVLGLNFKTALMQLTSFGNSTTEVGFLPYLKSSMQLLSRPIDSYKAIREKSAYMESRARMMDSFLREQLDQFAPNGSVGVVVMGKRFTLEQVQNAQFAIIQSFDAFVSYPTWSAAYEAALVAGVNEADAIAKADATVIRAQGSGGAMDTPKFLRRRGFIKFFTTFMSFAVNDFNRKKYYVGGFKEYLRGGNSTIDFKTFAGHVAMEWLTPAILSTLMLSYFRDGEEPEAKDFVWEALGNATMGIPILRDGIRYAQSKSNPQGGGGRMGGSVGFSGIESAINMASYGHTAIFDDDDIAGDKARRELINMLGFMTGISPLQVFRTIDGTEAYFVDGQGGILAPLFGKPRGNTQKAQN